MFCPRCGKQVDESDAFCRFCGREFGTQQAPAILTAQASPKASRGGVLFLFSILLTLIVGILLWQIWGEPGKRRRADQGIDAAVEACVQGGRAEFDRRMVEANLAIDDLDGVDGQIYRAKLDNRLIMMGCPK
jgi:hypothetical protein